MKYKIIVSAPYMQPIVDRFVAWFREENCEVVIPTLFGQGRRHQRHAALRILTRCSIWFRFAPGLTLMSSALRHELPGRRTSLLSGPTARS